MNILIFNCEKCNKVYSTASSLSNHKKKYHNDIDYYGKRIKNNEDNLYYCRYCDKKYKNRNSRWVHENKCILETEKNKMDKLKQEIIVIKQENMTLKTELKHNKEVICLHKKIGTANERTYKSFNSLNKVLMQRSITNNSHNVNSLNTTNNITNNIQQICNLGEEDVLSLTTLQEQTKIVKSCYNSIEKFIEITYCGKYNQFKNVVITNLKSDYAYKYDTDKGYFITVNKSELLDDIFDCRKLNIEEIYEELDNGNRLTSNQKHHIKDFLDKCESDERFKPDTNISYPNFKEYKKSNINVLLYNNRDQITKDIACLIKESNKEKEIQEPINIVLETV
jgi:hypothetical protein